MKTSAIILLAKTGDPQHYLFGAYDEQGRATGFLDLPEDHERFTQTLVNRQTIMGRKTLEATPKDFPDAGRICVTHHPENVREDAIGTDSISKAIEIAHRRAANTQQEVVYVLGGASILKQCIEQRLLDELNLTLAYAYEDKDFTPVYLKFTMQKWDIVEDSGILISQNSNPKNLKYRYLTLQPL